MTDKPISPLRQRMIDDMTARRIKEKVQKDYVRHVRTFAAFLGRSPDTATSEDLRRFQVHLAQLPIGVATINAAIAALRRLVFAAGPVTTARRQAARRRMRSAGDLEIPIGRTPPNSALRPRGFLLARLSNPGPRRLAQPSRKGPASETLQLTGRLELEFVGRRCVP